MKLKDGSKGWKEWTLKQWCRVDLIWTPGHEGIEGNERADSAAKSAAKGESSDKVKLPNFLKRKQLPISISATRQTLKKDLKARWAAEWTLSPRSNRIDAIDGTILSGDYLHIIDQLGHNQASLLTQLRTSHIPTNQVLHRIKQSDTPYCPHCTVDTTETLFHLLFHCPHYACAQIRLMSRIGRNDFTLQHILSSCAAIPHLLHYISDTGRFRATFREVRPPDGFVIKEKEPKGKNPRTDRSTD